MSSIVATTATVANRLTADLPIDLVSAGQREFLASQRYAANIHIAYRIPRLEIPPKVNSIFPSGAGRHALAALSFHRSKVDDFEQSQHELVSIYLSDPESRRVMDWSDETLAQHALQLGRVVYPALPSTANVFHIHRREEAIPIHEVGRYIRAVEFCKTQSVRSRRLYFCGDYLATATIDGAMATGYEVADIILGKEPCSN